MREAERARRGSSASPTTSSRSTTRWRPTTAPSRCWATTTLRAIARELVETVRKNVTIDWTVRENVRAQLRVLVKRILRKHGYPPDKQEKATQTVLEQAEVLSENRQLLETRSESIRAPGLIWHSRPCRSPSGSARIALPRSRKPLPARPPGSRPCASRSEPRAFVPPRGSHSLADRLHSRSRAWRSRTARLHSRISRAALPGRLTSPQKRASCACRSSTCGVGGFESAIKNG